MVQLGTISLDGTMSHADASKSPAVSAKRLRELDHQWRAEVGELCALSAQADQVPLPDGLILADAIARRQERLANVAQAKAVLAARAPERSQAERAADEAKRHAREEKARQQGREPPRPDASTATAGAARQGSVPLHRSGVAPHEKQHP